MDIVWSSVATGAVLIDCNNLPNWFNDSQLIDNRIDLKASWRQTILEQLSQYQRNFQSIPNIDKYIKAIELSSWIKSTDARYQNPNSLEYEECRIELEWVNGNGNANGNGNHGDDNTESCGSNTPTNDGIHDNDNDNNDGMMEKNWLNSGTLTVLHPDRVTTKIQFSLSAITCVQCCSEPGLPRLAIHANLRIPNNSSPVRLQFASDSEMEDWLSHLTSVCCQINEVTAKPHGKSIWATTELSEVFVFDPSTMKSQQWDENEKFYIQKMNTSTLETPLTKPLNNG